MKPGNIDVLADRERLHQLELAAQLSSATEAEHQ